MNQIQQHALKKLKSLHVDSGEVALHQTKGFSVTARLGEVETVEYHLEKNFSVAIYHQHRCGTASTSDFSIHAIDAAIEKALSIATFSNPDPFSGLADAKKLATVIPQCDLIHPWNITPPEAIALAVACEKNALAFDQRIVNSDGVSVNTIQSDIIYSNTLGFIGEYALTDHSIACSLVAKEKNNMQRDDAYTTARNPAELESIDVVAQRAAEKTVALLNARRLKTQNCAVIFDAPVAKSLLSAFVQAISGPQLYRQSTFLLNAMNTAVFPAFISIQQQPHLPSAMGSAPFDREGVATHNQYYVDNGKLIRYVLDSYSARKLNLETTGNSGGVFNLSITFNATTRDELMQNMKTGLLVTELMGHGTNITTGDYSRGASGFWIEHGKIQFPVEEITIAGNLKEIFSGIVGVANDIDIRSTIRTGSIWINRMTVAGE